MKRTILAVLVLAALAATTLASVIEDFEHGNTALYTQVGTGADNFTIVPAAAHDGMLGARWSTGLSPRWYYRTDLVTSAGNEYASFVRFTAGGLGRVYIGVNAGPGGTWSMVAASNTSNIILQENTAWGFADRASAGFTFATDTWYRMHLEWAATGHMTVKIFSEFGTTPLASTTPYATGLTGSGGLALRGFTTATGTSVDVDTIVPEPSTLLCLSAALLLLARRR